MCIDAFDRFRGDRTLIGADVNTRPGRLPPTAERGVVGQSYLSIQLLEAAVSTNSGRSEQTTKILKGPKAMVKGPLILTRSNWENPE
jgi:hypothetical protein